MNCAQRLKRVFNIDIAVCGRCGGSLQVIACIEDQLVCLPGEYRSGGANGISRQSVGNYAVVFQYLAAYEADGNVVVSAYGAPGGCIVDTWTPRGAADLDLDVEVQCYDLSGSSADLRQIDWFVVRGSVKNTA